MRIAELTRPPTRQSAGMILRKAGYVPSGKGSFATTWVKPGSPFILKLYSTRDRAYSAFVKLVMTTPNRHFPILRGKPIQINDTYSAIRVEKMPPPPPNFWDLIKLCGEYLGWLSFIDEGIDVAPLTVQVNEFRKKYRSLAQAIDLMYVHIIRGNENMMNDIDIGNTRMRGNDLVFTHPIGWGGGPAIFGEADLEPSRDEIRNIEADRTLKKRGRARNLLFAVVPGN